MKTKATVQSRIKNSVMSQYKDGFRIGAILIMLVGMALASCSDDDKAATPDTRQQFVGNYSVKDIRVSTGYQYEYGVSIAIGSKGDLEISNFADLMKVPVKAKARGNELIIESQTFKNPSSGKTITLEGSGTFANDVLTFTYTTVGALDYTGKCTAEKY
jgi:hypothetical protein